MRRRWNDRVARVAAALSLAGCGTDPEAPTEPVAEAPATAHWMADVFADRPDTEVGRILLPGAFNSSSYACDVGNGMSPDAPETVIALWGEDGSADETIRQRIVDWAKTQGLAIGQQLDDGIRFVELNLTVRDGALMTWHSVYGVPVDDVLDPLVAFSVAWPDEVVVLTFGLTVDPEDWPLFAEALAAPRAEGLSLCDRIYDGPEDAAHVPLSAIRERGRNVIWSPDGDLRAFLEERGDCPLTRGGVDRVWSITDSLEGVEAALANSVDSRDPDRLLINDFVFSLDGAGDGAGQVQYILGYSGVQEASQVLGFSGDFPERLIETWDAGGNMNVFAGAWYQDTTLVDAAIAANRDR